MLQEMPVMSGGGGSIDYSQYSFCSARTSFPVTRSFSPAVEKVLIFTYSSSFDDLSTSVQCGGEVEKGGSTTVNGRSFSLSADGLTLSMGASAGSSSDYTGLVGITAS